MKIIITVRGGRNFEECLEMCKEKLYSYNCEFISHKRTEIIKKEKILWFFTYDKTYYKNTMTYKNKILNTVYETNMEFDFTMALKDAYPNCGLSFTLITD